MASKADVVSVLIALEFVIMGSIVLLTSSLEAVAPIVPLFLVFLVALLKYRW